MSPFNAELLRERFVVTDVTPLDFSDQVPLVALSNRLKLPLTGAGGRSETFVVRAQNMHTTLRLGSRITRDFHGGGPLMTRATPYDWTSAIDSVLSAYEKNWNPRLWVAVYHEGQPVFEHNTALRHPFLDVIEHCDATGGSEYEKNVDAARETFRRAGKLVNISHYANLAATITVADHETKCAIALRGANRVTNFFLTARTKSGEPVPASQGLSVTAAFLEAIQLSFVVGTTNQKIKSNLIEQHCDEALQASSAKRWLARINRTIRDFEEDAEVFYRPERPNFSKLIADADDFVRKSLRTQFNAGSRRRDMAIGA